MYELSPRGKREIPHWQETAEESACEIQEAQEATAEQTAAADCYVEAPRGGDIRFSLSETWHKRKWDESD